MHSTKAATNDAKKGRPPINYNNDSPPMFVAVRTGGRQIWTSAGLRVAYKDQESAARARMRTKRTTPDESNDQHGTDAAPADEHAKEES